MQTRLIDELRGTPTGERADRVLRKCVHCGFCNATCPTYRLRGDELDGPRGRIYLIKQALEGQRIGAATQLHLDRCLTCRACETTCPSGVDYHVLLDIGRAFVDQRVPRPLRQRLRRWALRRVVPYRRRFAGLLRTARLIRPLLPRALRARIPAARVARPWPRGRHDRRALVLAGCVQPALAPGINAAAARVLDRLGIELHEAPAAGCCGALSHHLGAVEEGKRFARANVDAWWPHLETSAEAIVSTASGCGAHLREYATLLADDADYAEKARIVTERVRDVAELLRDQDLSALGSVRPSRVAFQSPCTLQHALGLGGVVEDLLGKLGFELTRVTDGQQCCGSAGAYSLLQTDLAGRLRSAKIEALEADEPERILTANIGCLTHLAAATDRPVQHWIEAVADATCGGFDGPETGFPLPRE